MAPSPSDDRLSIHGGRRPAWRRVLKIVAFVVAAIPLVAVAATLAAVVYLRTDGGRERVRKLVLAEARATVPGLQLGRIEGDYLHELALKDVSVFDREGRRAVHADRVYARFSLWPLLRRRIQVAELRIESARVLGEPGRSGALNLTELTTSQATTGSQPPPSKPPGSSPWGLVAERIVVSDARAQITTPGGETLVLSRLELEAMFAMSADRIDAAVERLTAAGLTPAPLLLTARLGGSRQQMDVGLTVTALGESEAAAPHLTLNGRVGLAAAPDGATALGDYHLTLNLAELDPAALTLEAPEGRLNAQVTARGHGAPLQPGTAAQLVLDLATSRIRQLELPAARITADTDGESWRVPPATISIPGAQATLSGQGRARDLKVEAALKLGGPAGLLPRQLDVPRPAATLKGRGRLDLTVTGQYPDRLAVRARGGLTGFKADALSIKQASIAADVQGLPAAPRGHVQLAVRTLRTTGPDALTLDTLTADLNGDGRTLRIHAAAAGPGLNGGIDAHGVMTPTSADVTVDRLSLAVTTPRYRQELALQKPAVIAFRAGDRVTLGPTQLRGKGFRLTGEVRLEGAYDLSPQRRDPLATVAFSARKASFNGFDPLDADLRATVGMRRSLLSLDARVARARLQVNADVPLLIPRRGPPRLASKGAVGLSLKSDQVHLEDLPVLQKALAKQGISGGTVNLTASLTGDIASPIAKAQFDVQNLMFRSIRGVGRDSTIKTIAGLGGALQVSSQPGEVHVAGQVMLKKTGLVNFDVRSQIDLGAIIAGGDPMNAPVKGTIDIPAFKLASLAEFTDRMKGVEGTLLARAALTGTPRRPSGTADVEIGDARVDAVKFHQIKLHAEARDGHVRGGLTLNQATGGTLTAAGELRRAQGDALTATMNGKDLDIGFLRPLMPNVRELGGALNLWASARGTLKAPTLKGGVDLRKGRLGLIGQPTFRDLGLTLAISPGRVELTRLAMRSGDGTLTGKGWVTLDGLNPQSLVLTAHAERFLIAAAGSTGARLDGDLAVEAAMRESVVAGKVGVPRAVVWLPKVGGGGGRNLQRIGPRDDVRFVDPAAMAAQEKQQDDAKADARKPTVLDIKTLAGPVYVRSKDLDIEVESNLTISTITKGPARGKPALTGAVRIRRGHINIQRQRFNFDRGDITFSGDPALDPALDIRLTHDYPDATVAVHITGTPKKPKLRLTSDPPIYDEAQIVSLVLTGQPGGQPSSGKGFDPTAAVATMVLGKLADKLAPELGLDVLRVENVEAKTAEGTPTGDTDTRIEVGKYISERVYLSYAHVFGATENQNANEAHVEYRITRRWIAETVFGDAGVGGIDALWTYRY